MFTRRSQSTTQSIGSICSLWTQLQTRNASVNANSIRPGNLIRYNNRILSVVKAQHTKTGRGSAFVQTELRDIKADTKLKIRLRSAETVERIHVDKEQWIFSWSLPMEGQYQLNFNTSDYLQDLVIMQNDIAWKGNMEYMTEGLHIDILFENGNPLIAELPDSVTVSIKETDAYIKGQTVQPKPKNAIIETHVEEQVKIQVPQFINVGDKVEIKTADGQYLRRA
eukprot:TRINITY_DN1535_c0_g1_i1.p1 TRINITY_DN1535_c0_g1~~TRINITY_DN1535_c0_g1_i1.p1  ORF type:complete len:224 (+),score=55.69 TRINITY_DN1535_c0_g1_i1:162-833(+)